MATKKYIVEIDAKTGELERKVDEAKGKVDELGDSAEEAGNDFSAFGDIADRATGGLVSGAKAALGSVRGLAGGFKGLKGAIIGTGIGALIVALGALVNWFSSSEKGAKLLDRATIALQVVFKQVSDAVNSFLENDLVSFFEDPISSIENLWEAIKTNLINRFEGFVKTLKAVGKVLEGVFNLDWDMIKEGAAETGDAILQTATGIEDPVDKIGEAFNKLGEEIDKVEKKADSMSATADKLRIATRELTVENARLQTGIEVQQKIIDDTTRSYEERAEALDKQSAMTLELAENEAKLARLNEQAIRDQISITNNIQERRDLEQELADAQAERIEKEAAIQLIELENSQKRREVDLEEFERQKAIRDQLEDLRAQQITDEEELAMRELKLEEQRALDELKILRATEEEKQRVRDEFANLREQKEQEFVEKERQRQKEISEIIAASEMQRAMDEDERFFADLAKKEEQALIELEQMGATRQQIEQLQANFDEQRLAKEREINERRTETEKQLQRQKVDLALEAGQALSGLLDAFGGESEKNAKRVFKVNKALGIAEAIINTARAIQAQLAVPQDALTGANFVKAGIVAATGAAQVAKIASTQFQGGGGGGGGGAPTAPASAGTVATGAPTLATPEAPDTSQQSIRAYVVEKNVTDAQSQNQKINEQASLTV